MTTVYVLCGAALAIQLSECVPHRRTAEGFIARATIEMLTLSLICLSLVAAATFWSSKVYGVVGVSLAVAAYWVYVWWGSRARRTAPLS